MSDRKPETVQEAASQQLKTSHRRSRKYGCELSLKAFARDRAQNDDMADDALLAQRWLHNKSVNTANPSKHIGNTRKRKGQ